jgi:lysozyme
MTIASRLNQALTLVKAFETFHARAAPQTDGGFVIGYGHTASAREGAVVSRDEAEALLVYDLCEIGRLIDAWVYAPLHDNQRQALIAFGFHIGAPDLHTSTAMRRLNAGDYMGCAREIERWRMAELAGRGQVVDALVRRRAAEKALFLTPPEGFPKAAGARLKPRFDGDRRSLMLAETPVETPTEPASAAMTAAQNVAARLRALMPDPVAQPAPEPEPPEPPEPPELELPESAGNSPGVLEEPEENFRQHPPSDDVPNQDIEAEPVSHLPNAEVAGVPPAPPAEAPPTIWPLSQEPPPPPFIPETRNREPSLLSANDGSPAAAAPSHPVHQAAIRGAVPVPPRAAEAADRRAVDPGSNPAWRERLAQVLAMVLRRGHLIFGAVGVILFIISVIAILTGKPSAANLALGMVGVLCMTPAAYALLGDNRSSYPEQARAPRS